MLRREAGLRASKNETSHEKSNLEIESKISNEEQFSFIRIVGSEFA